jgi:hypothetical protein
MAGPKLDSAGAVKMKVLDEAVVQLQRIHGLVEQYGLAVKRGTPGSVFVMNIRRQLPSLAANLKAQFGMVSELVTGVALASSRGGSEAVRIRAMRDGVAQIKQALDIAYVQTKDKHTVQKEVVESPPGTG